VETIVTSAPPGDLDALAGQALDGSLPVTVSGRYPFADGVRACTDLLRAHTRGKLVIAGDGDTYLTPG
jgi:NADPH2:quinone reductase